MRCTELWLDRNDLRRSEFPMEVSPTGSIWMNWKLIEDPALELDPRYHMTGSHVIK